MEDGFNREQELVWIRACGPAVA